MDIVDAQLHLGRGMITATLEAMNALNIQAILIDEFWGTWRGTHPTHIDPGYLLENGAWRAAWPTAEEACLLHPKRFSYLVRIDRQDPQLEALMRVLASSPPMRAFRLQPVWTLAEASAFAQGAYEPVFDLAQDLGVPVFLFVPGYAELLPHYLRKYPALSFVIDHCGMGFENIPPGRPEPEARATLDKKYFDKVLKLSEFPNVALKWSHTQSRFGVEQYPYEPLRPLLRKAISAFGAHRILWASDKSVNPAHSWSDMLHSLRDDPELSQDEKSWILGRSARHVLNWPEGDTRPESKNTT